MRNFFFILFTFLFIGCTGKQLTIKSLQPSLITNDKIYNLILEDFENDRINQTNYLEEKLVNTTVEGKRVFELQPTYENIDAIVTGRVLQSTVNIDFYYNQETDYTRCLRYKYVDGKRTKQCIKYRERRIPCERKNYTVKTNVQVLNKNEKILFSKVYTKTKYTDQCYESRYYYEPYFYRPSFSTRNEYHINSTLAKQIAHDVINDISPHYIYQNITIIEDLNEKYGSKIKDEFKSIVEFLDNGNINISQSRLHKLNNKLDFKSHEVLYNLALTYEAKDQLENAKNYYIESRSVCEDIDDLKFIEAAINRTQLNLENKIKAKSQLP